MTGSLASLSACSTAARPDRAAASQPSLPEFVVRAALVLPLGCEPPTNAEAAYGRLILDIQDFFAAELDRQGHGARRFSIERRNASQHPKLHIVHSDLDRTELAAGTARQHHDRLISEAIQAGLTVDRPGQAWLILAESSGQTEDGSLSGIVALGIRGRRDGNENNGVAVRTGPVLQVVGQNALDDHSVVLDRVWPVLGPHEVRSDSFPWFAHGTRSGIASSIIGSTAHELGHAFGLLHTYANDGLWRHRNLGPGAAVHYGTLMGNGFRAWRSWREAGAFSSPASPEYLRLAPASADLLALSPFFGGSDTSFDPTPPVIAAPPETRIDEGTWSLTVHATASDPESGIALAQLYSGRETVASMSFPERPARAELTFETARIPMPRPGIRNTGWQLRIFNGSFHEQAVPLAVTLPAGFTPGARIDLILPEATATVSEPVAMWARRRGPLEHGAPTEFRWDMGDGTRLAGERVEHAYSIPGVYKIALTAEFADGRTANAMDRIRIVER